MKLMEAPETIGDYLARLHDVLYRRSGPTPHVPSITVNALDADVSSPVITLVDAIARLEAVGVLLRLTGNESAKLANGKRISGRFLTICEYAEFPLMIRILDLNTAQLALTTRLGQVRSEITSLGPLKYLDEIDLTVNDIFEAEGKTGNALFHESMHCGRDQKIKRMNLFTLSRVMHLRDHEECAARIESVLNAIERRTVATEGERFVESGADRLRIPEPVRHEVWRRDGGRCTQCGSQENLEFDHMIPVVKGGSNIARNIQLLCETCNRKKGAAI
jgi:hypothetical protein